ncbi:hypothetical protein [Paradesulfitobacterium ferrireducens]|uniref:hypothetical protein n=1 Tax=Paradesulfitobacterium ferrireducens TaxID=2816476 RepID=UPI001A8DA87F|nr:hypothetical protein [Paradesulfitobacterium ferrireducens]
MVNFKFVANLVFIVFASYLISALRGDLGQEGFLPFTGVYLTFLTFFGLLTYLLSKSLGLTSLGILNLIFLAILFQSVLEKYLANDLFSSYQSIQYSPVFGTISGTAIGWMVHKLNNPEK